MLVSPWGKYRQQQFNLKIQRGYLEDVVNEALTCDLRYQGQLEDTESGLYYNLNRYYDADSGQYLSSDPIGMLGGLRPQAYVHNPMEWVDPLGLAGASHGNKVNSEDSAYKGKLTKKSSEMKPLVKGSKEWKQAVKDAKAATAKGEKFQVKVKSSSDAKEFLKETHGDMNRYKAHTQSGRPDGVPKYPKGYEQHMGPEGGFGDTPHIKWYNNETDGHIFYDIPN